MSFSGGDKNTEEHLSKLYLNNTWRRKNNSEIGFPLLS